MSLTPKQEKFCQCIVSGMSGKDSYLTAYNCNSDRVAYNESNVLLQRDDITERINELMIPVKNHAQNTAINEREKKKALIWERINHCMSVDDDSSVARYLDILNKMDSEYININRTITDNNDEIKELDTDKLIRLVGTA